MSPQRPNLVLAADVPDVKLDILIRDTFNVESDSGDGGYVLIQL